MNIEKLLSTIQELKDRKETNEVINHAISENLQSFYYEDIVNKTTSNINLNVKKEILNKEDKNSRLETKLRSVFFWGTGIVLFYVVITSLFMSFNKPDEKTYLISIMTPVLFWFLCSVIIILFIGLFMKKSSLKIEDKKDLCINNAYEKEIKKITVDIIEDISSYNTNQNDSVVYLKNYLLKNLREYEYKQTTSDNFFLKLKNSIKEEIFNKDNVLETKKINNAMHESTELDNYYSTLVKSIQKDKV